MKPALVFGALASILFFTFYGQQKLLREYQDKVEGVQLVKETAEKQVQEAEAKARDQEDQVMALKAQILTAESELQKEKKLVETLSKAPAPEAPKVVVEAPKPVVKAGPNAEQLANRQNAIGSIARVLILKDGTLLRNQTYTKIESGQIFFHSPDGDVTVGRDNLPKELITVFGLDMDEYSGSSSTLVASTSNLTSTADSGTSDPMASDSSNSSSSSSGATPFGFQVDNTNDSRQSGANLTKSNVAMIISELHARADQLRAAAATATDAAQAQSMKDRAAKFEKQANDLQASVSG